MNGLTDPRFMPGYSATKKRKMRSGFTPFWLHLLWRKWSWR
ncbi:MAG: hypothetical protein OJF59_001622 [Cytophagales bacterium]|nr:MAG: hypothetical protein OJF59_001622 [Cytophagales bacterium]